ncbi:MerR family transcriptional regulator [bacterium]|nr:MerR family transcriptional regulator [candidate division CSSED10-310 bacterium]
MQPKKRLKIGEVSKLLNIPAYVLRYWENEFIELHPDKSRAGQRLYDEAEVEIIRKIATLRYSEKLTINGCKNRLKQENDDKPAGKETSVDSEILLDRIGKIKKGLQDVLDELG